MGLSALQKLKKQSQESLNTYRDEMEKETKGGGGNQDDRFWKPTFNEDKGTGYAVVRFLPPPDGETLPWVKLYNHWFKGPTGKTYFENSLTTKGKGTADPVSEMNSRLWNSGIESDKDVARKYKRRLNYYTNVLVIKDPANPENEGRVFLYRFGQKIFEKIQDVMNPEFEGEDAVNPFDPWSGANFQIKMRVVNDFINYDKSEFDAPEAIGTDDEIEEYWKQCHSLESFLEDSNFKTYDELKNRLFEVLGDEVGSGIEVIEGIRNSKPSAPEADDEDDDLPPPNRRKARTASATVSASASTDDDEDESEDEDDKEAMAFFNDMAADD